MVEINRPVVPPRPIEQERRGWADPPRVRTPPADRAVHRVRLAKMITKIIPPDHREFTFLMDAARSLDGSGWRSLVTCDDEQYALVRRWIVLAFWRGALVWSSAVALATLAWRVLGP